MMQQQSGKFYLKLTSFVRRLIFKNNSIVAREWPLSILLQVIILRRDYVRNFCCYCQKNLSFSRSNRTGDSGDICLPCLLKNWPDVYFDMKESGKLSQAQIDEAEKPLFIKP